MSARTWWQGLTQLPALSARRPRSIPLRPEALEARTLLSSAGSLDSYFGTGGIATTLIGSLDGGVATAALEPDQEIVIAGEITQSGGEVTAALARYTTSGQLDTSFGSGGEVVVNPALKLVGQLVAVVNDPGQPDDGKIVVAGPGSLARFNPDGSPDTHFGNSGVVTLPTGIEAGLVLEPGGKIVVAIDEAASGHVIGTLERFNSNGSLDTSFGTSGTVAPMVGGSAIYIGGLALDLNDGIYIAGSPAVASQSAQIVVSHLTAGGALDPTFGTGGIETTVIPSPATSAGASAVAIDPTGGIVVAGSAVVGTQSEGIVESECFVAHYDSSGALSSSFNRGAIEFIGGTETTQGELGGLAVQPDGKVLVAGARQIGGGTPEGPMQVYLARLNGDGTFDPTFDFSIDAETYGLPAASSTSMATALLLQRDGNIVVDGISSSAGVPRFALERVLGASTASSGTTPTLTPPQVGPITVPAPPVRTGATVAVSASFTYVSTQGPCTAIWNWGDGTTSSGSVTESNGSGSVTGTHAYQAGGVYPVTLTVTDNSGAAGRSTAFPGIAVWQPVPESLTGNIRLLSPRDAIAGDSSLTGSATLVLDARFNASGTPKGKVALKFKPAHLSFKSTALSAVAVDGTSVWLEGTGTVNGALPVDFLLSADGTGTRSGKIRLQLWDAATLAVVYDNQPGALAGAAPTDPIRGGTLALHVQRPHKLSKQGLKA